MINLKTQKRKILSAVLCAAVGGVLAVAGATGIIKAKITPSAEVTVNIVEELSDTYAFGDVFVLPQCTFTKDGDSAEGVASLQYPDGTQTGEIVNTLNQSGNYVLKYIANLDGNVYTKEYPFTVYGRLASYESAKTSMEYGLNTHLGANSEGLTVRIANGDALAFDHVFDMTKVTTSTKLLEGFVVPNTQGTVDFSRMVFTFTDVEDPSVQLVYYGNFHNDSNAYGLTYFTAAGNGQIQCGLEHVGRLHVGSTLGCMVPHSFMAMDTGLYWGAQAPAPAAPDAKKFCIGYDYKTNQAWASGKIISDLDDSNYYNSLWFGFPSGKAKLTISALNYNDATANMCFTSILGVDLSAANFIDEEAPMITVDNEYAEMPKAMVGGNYPVPTATAYDYVNGECKVNVSVWHNYGLDGQKMVDVQNGKFKVSEVGSYAIVYEATDFAGNLARTVLWTRAYLSQYIPKLTVTIGETAAEYEVGVMQTLPEIMVGGGSGNVDVSYTLTMGKEKCEIVDGKFRLEKAGEWTLTCTAIDYVGNVTANVCTLNAVTSGKPVLQDEPQFPAAYVSGGTYELPVLYAYDYSSGKKEQKLCDVSVTLAGQTANFKAGQAFTPTVDTDKDSVHIRYVCDGETVCEREIPVHVVFTKERIPGSTERYRDVVNVEKYFYTTDDLSFVNGYDLSGIKGLMISANSEIELASATFINAQAADNFSLALLTMPQQSKFAGMNIILTDSLNGDISLTAALRKDEGQTQMTVGETVLSLAVDFDGATATPYTLGFNGKAFVVNGMTVAVNKTDNGEAFNGFPSGKVFFKVELCEAEKGGSVFIQKICEINANNKQDTTGPFLTTKEEVITSAVKDSVYTVQAIFANDVLCPNVQTALTVITPSGEIAVSVDGVALQGVDATKEYQISLSEYGDYLVSVTAKEGKGWKYSNESYFEYTLTVMDGEKPTLEFKGKFDKSLKVGGTLSIPKYTVSDNFTKAEDITVVKMIINPKGMPIYLYGDVNSIKCEYAGEYKIYFYVYDEMGNLTTFETSVWVK